MNNRQRDAAADALRAVAVELEGAKAHAQERAAAGADEMQLTGEYRKLFMEATVSGWVTDALTRGAARIRAAVDVYLTPKTPGRRSPRGRR